VGGKNPKKADQGLKASCPLLKTLKKRRRARNNLTKSIALFVRISPDFRDRAKVGYVERRKGE